MGQTQGAQPAADRIEQRRSLRNRLLSALAGTLIVAMLLYGLGTSYLTYQVENATRQRVQAEKIHDVAGQVAAFLQHGEDDLILATLTDWSDRQAQGQVLRNLLRQNRALLELVCVDAQGNLVASAFQQESVLLTADMQSGWLADARAGRLVIGNIQVPPQGEAYLVLAIPAPNGGAAAGRLRLSIVWQILADLNAGPSEWAYIVDQNSRIVAHTNQEHVTPGSAVNLPPEMVALWAAPAGQWSSTYRNFQGRHVLGAARVLPGTNWMVIAEELPSEAFAASRSTLLLLAAGILLLSAIVAVAFRRLLQGLLFDPLRALEAGAETIGMGNLDERIHLARRDEIGRVATAFNAMVDRLQERDEQLERQNAQLAAEVAERRRTEEALRESESRATAVLEHVQAGVMLIDAQDHRVINVNPAALRLLGHSTKGDVLQRVCHQFICPAAAGKCPITDLNQAVDNREGVLIRADGSRLPIMKTAARVTFAGRQYILESFVDLTERKRAEEVLRQAHNELERAVQERTAELALANQELSQREASLRDAMQSLRAEIAERQRYAAKLENSNAELQQFAYVASHDLQEPLRKVQAFGDRLRDRYGSALGEQGLDYLNRMQNAATRMQALIEGLLTFSRVVTKAQPFSPVDLNKIAGEVLSDLETRVAQVGGTVEVGHLPTLDADPLQMRQLLQNLIGNALKFHREGVPPVVRINAERLNGHGGQEPGPERYQITVTDNGIGFEEKYVDRIFQVFQRLHGRSAYEGTGIGLAVCRKIVDRHLGDITASSAPGQGATFIVTLPAHQAVDGEAGE